MKIRISRKASIFIFSMQSPSAYFPKCRYPYSVVQNKLNSTDKNSTWMTSFLINYPNSKASSGIIIRIAMVLIYTSLAERF